MARTLEEIKSASKEFKSWPFADQVAFHVFNDNGLCARWQRNCKRISEAVDAGLVPNGWVVAYGSLDSTAYDKFVELERKARIGRTEYLTRKHYLEERCFVQETKLNSL